MKYLSSLKIRTRLFLTMIICLVGIAAIAAYSLNATARVGEVIDTINAHPMVVSNTAVDSQLIVAGIQAAYREAYITKDPAKREQYRETIQEYEKSLDSDMATIQSLILGEEGQTLARKTTAGIMIWRKDMAALMDRFYDEENRETVRMLVADKELNGTAEVQRQLQSIQNYAKNKAKTLGQEADAIQIQARTGIAVMGAALVTLLTGFVLLIIRNVSESLSMLQRTMSESMDQNKFLKVDLVGDNEIVDVGHYYNGLIGQLENQYNMENGLNELSNTISGNLGMKDFAGRIISFLSEYTRSGNGVFYLYDEEKGDLALMAAYAFTDRQKGAKRLQLGESLIGQAALDRKPILLKHVTSNDGLISSGIISEVPLNIIALPLIFEDRLYGAIELSSFEPFDTTKTDYLDAAAEIIAVSVYSAFQREKIQGLLNEAQQANVLLEIQKQQVVAKSDELAHKNEQLTELLKKSMQQQEELQVQQEELRQNNEELEEQAQALRESEEKLQMQQEELRVTNEELQAYALQLEEQKRILNEKNCALAVTQSEMCEKTEALERANAYKSEFMANMSHELRTPLNSILVLSQLLLHREAELPLSEKEKEFAGIIHSSGQDLLTLINGLLDLAKVEAGKMEVQTEKVYISDIVTDNRNMFEQTAAIKKLALKFAIFPGVPEYIETDGQRLSQILKNLIANAIKFTHTGSVSVSFRRPTGKEAQKLIIPREEYIVVAVKDTGIGIPSEKMHEIFEAFKQSDGTTSRQYGGTGLGLTISLKLAKLLGGYILHESEVNAGSEFVLVLPVKPLAVAMQSEVLTDGEWDASPAVPEELDALSTAADASPDYILPEYCNEKTVLIIEDDTAFAQTLAALAEEKGYTAVTAYTGMDGISLAKAIVPTGIIMNIDLPDMHGMAVAQTLSEDERTSRIPIHAISGSEEFNETARLEYMPKSIIGFLKKPIDIKTIFKTLSKIESINPSESKRILVVGDCGDEDFKALKVLEQVRIKKVLTAEEAFVELESQAYGCIILDIKLSDASGVDFMKRLQGKTGAKTPIIIYTAEEISLHDIDDITKYAESIILKSPKSRDRLVDEVLLFLHDMQRRSPEKLLEKGVFGNDMASLNGVRILLADDSSRNVTALRALLEQHGMQVVVARDGVEAVSQFAANEVDLILMDIMMPNMDGYEAIRQIRDHVKGRHTPIIALTAKAMAGDRDKCINAGANDYLTKPVESNRLLSMIKVWQS